MDQIEMCYVSMDSYWQALQTNGKLFFKFRINLEFFWPKTEFFSKK